MSAERSSPPTRGELNAFFERTAALYGGNAAFLETLYERYLDTPLSVDEQWRRLFAAIDRTDDEPEEVADSRAPDADIASGGRGWSAPTSRFKPTWEPKPPRGGDRDASDDGDKSRPNGIGGGVSAAEIAERLDADLIHRLSQRSSEAKRRATLDSVRALMMIRAFRIRGHLAASLDPLQLSRRDSHPELSPSHYGFAESDLDRPIFIDHVLGLETASVREMLAILKRTYCSTLGIEFMHISEPEQKSWLQRRIEGPDKIVSFTPEGRRAILFKTLESEEFEKYLNLKYTGTKRFGLDGGESLIPALEQIIKRGAALGVREIVVGMPHRGRLNVLANVMGKPREAIFHEFRGGSSNPDEVEGSGDVKYHLGTSSDRTFDGETVHLSLTANPSHLEAVDPVTLGKTRAKQDQRRDYERKRVLPLLLHGDAAFAGQGVVAECLGLSGLRGHRTGGSIHVIVNNQIGFTTSPLHGRSSPYPSDVAKMIGAPILHVNGDDPESVVFAARMATEFRQTFGKSVVIDMFCYRRHGHNESDEPFFTQPLMYRKIREHPRVSEVYGRRLIEEGVISEAEIESERERIGERLESEFSSAESYRPDKADWYDGRWSGLKRAGGDLEAARKGRTGVAVKTLSSLGRAMTEIPSTFRAHPTLTRILGERRRAVEEDLPIDWALAEHLAFASLLQEGYGVRLSGQDSERGTFSQRHATLIDQEDESRLIPLNRLSDDQGRFEVVNSMLSEMAVLGFEYGYSVAEPNCLTLWEAQFGDFANGAQVIIDQFIASGEAKWLRASGLVMLLPHGYEGQGPEHSSARLERFLQLCGEDNMQVANCSTPANYFHILRRQMKREFRKPLAVMTPKSLLRRKEARSRLAELGPRASFHRVLWDDADSANPWRRDDAIELKPDAKIRRVALCSGKVYYDLAEARNAKGIDDVYLMRVEQLHPFPRGPLTEELRRFPSAEAMWCQEEPLNMGAWSFAAPRLADVLKRLGREGRAAAPRVAGRKDAAAPAGGLMSRHLAETEKLVAAALE